MSKLLANQIANYGDDAPIEIKEGLNIPAGKPIQVAGNAGSSGQVLSTTGATIEWVDNFDGNYNSLANRPSIPAAQVPADWDASGGVARILNKPVVPPLSSVTTAAASGGGSLSYNGVNGEFTFTPASISPNWDTAYGWGNHANAGYVTAEADTLDTVTGRGATTTNAVQVGRLDINGTSQSIIPSVNNGVTFQNTFTGGTILLRAAGDVEIQSYQGSSLLKTNTGAVTTGGLSLYYATGLTTEVVRLTTTNSGLTINGSVELGSGNITTTGKLLYANHYDTLGDLPGASTYHGMFAHVHNEGHGYFAHAGAWTQLVDTTSSIDELGDVDLSSAPSDGYVLKWEQSSSSWKAQPDLVGSGGSGIVLGDLSVSTQSASGGGSLSYGNTTGVFTYTPPDLSGFLSAETDPVFSASPAAGILSSNISNWDAAYGWGNHASAGYLTAVSLGLNSLTDVTINQSNINNGDVLAWNQTNSRWENSTGGGGGSDDLDDVTGRGAVTTNNIQVNKVHSDTILAIGPTAGDSSTGTYVSMEWDGGSAYRNMNFKSTDGGGQVTLLTLSAGTNTVSTTTSFTAGSLTASGSAPKLTIYNAPSTGYAELTYTAASVAAYTLPELPSSSGDVLSCTTAGVMSWVTPASGGGGANVTISDTIPAGTPAAGDLWWESDTGRLKVYYTDVDSSQWVDTNPPLSYENINGVVSANGFKFRTNLSSPPAGTLGELRQIDSKPHFFDGTSWQEIILGSTSAITLPAETAWDNVIVRTTFDNDANDYRFGATGALDTLSFASIATSTLVESPVKVGTKALKSLGSGVKYPHRSEYLFSGEFTIEFWIYFDDANISSTTNSGEQEIISKSNGSFNAGSWSLITTKDAYGNRNWELKNHNIATNAVSKLILEATSGVGWAANYSQQWVHIAITKDNNGALHFYRDGTEDVQTSPGTKFANDISNNNHDLMIGGGVNTTSNCFDGFIDGLRITTDTRYDSINTNGTPAFTPPTTILPISGSTTTYTPPATSSAGSFTLGSSPAWTGTLGVTVAQQSSGNYRLTFTNPFTNATDYYVFAHHMDGAEAMVVASVRSTGYVDFSVKNVAGSLIDTGSLAVQIIAH